MDDRPREPIAGGALRSGGDTALESSNERGVGSSCRIGESWASSGLAFEMNRASWFSSPVGESSLGGGAGGGKIGTDRDRSVDLLFSGGDCGTGGGAALGVEANGGGGGNSGGASLNGDWRLVSSMLDS